MFASSRLIALCTPNCKSLWIKASAKWLNVNVNVRSVCKSIKRRKWQCFLHMPNHFGKLKLSRIFSLNVYLIYTAEVEGKYKGTNVCSNINSVCLIFVCVCSAAGVLHYLKETFTHTPSYDVSPAMLSMLIRLMLAQAQECLFEHITLPGIRNEFFSLLRIAQEAAKVLKKIYDITVISYY